MNNLILNELKQSLQDPAVIKLWEEDCNESDYVLFALLTGSSITPYESTDSDIDVQLFTNTTCQYIPLYDAFFYDRHLHWWYAPLYLTWTSTPSAHQKIPQTYVGLYLWKYFSPDNLLYIHPNLIGVEKIISQYQETFSLLGLYFYMFSQIEGLRYQAPYIVKTDWIVIDYYYYYNQIPITDIEIDFIVRLKRNKLTKLEHTQALEMRNSIFQLLQKQLKQQNIYKLWMETIIKFAEDVEALRNVNI